ncbi:hypothetical protein VNI00_010328 [Paramarasmius palmivorus]|uniref:Uncharacterized protein n=1 Tax=Paramarasmius palmivorus TaxID=297713 RepID=A0AAW0CIP6_9AGAR
MTKSDPVALAQYRHDARLDLYGEAELKWLREEFPTLPDETHRMMQIWRARSRKLLRKRELSHARYLRNRKALQDKSLVYQRRRQALLKQDSTADLYFREDHREAQRRYYERNKDAITAKAKARRARTKQISNVGKIVPLGKRKYLSQRTRSKSSYAEYRICRDDFVWLTRRALSRKLVTTLRASSLPVSCSGTEAASSIKKDLYYLPTAMVERASEANASEKVTNAGTSLDGPFEESDTSRSKPDTNITLREGPDRSSPNESLTTFPRPLEETGASSSEAGPNITLEEVPDRSSPDKSLPSFPHEEDAAGIGPSSSTSRDEALDEVDNAVPHGVEENLGEKGGDGGDSNASKGKGKKKKRRPGNPGNFQGEPLEFLEAAYPEYEKLKRRSKESGDWLRKIIAEFIAKFPPSKYPPPRARQMEELEEVDLSSLTPDERKTHKRKMAARAANEREEERLAQAIRRFFHWKASDMRAKEGESVSKFLKTVVKESARPRKQQLENYLMSHPDYRDEIASESKETSSTDRLPNRRQAAKKVWNAMEEQKQKGIMEEIDRNLAAALKAYRESKEGEASTEAHLSQTRRSVGRIMQPIIDTLHRETGLSFVLLAGEDMNGQGMFDSATLSASPPGTPKITQYNVEKFQEFIGFFFRYLRMIREHQNKLGQSKDTASNEVSASSASTSVSIPENSNHDDSVGSEVTPIIGPEVVDARLSKKAAENEDYSSESEEESIRGGDEDAYGGYPDNEEGSQKDEEDSMMENDESGKDHKYPNGSYMAQRADNIRRNQALLRSLGLDRSIFAPAKPKTAAKSRSSSASSSTIPQRRSKRLNKKGSEEIEVSNKGVEEALVPPAINPRRHVLAECQRFIEDDPQVTTASLTDLVVALTQGDSAARAAWVGYISHLGDVWREKQDDPLGNIDWPAPPDAELSGSDGWTPPSPPEPITTAPMDEDIQTPPRDLTPAPVSTTLQLSAEQAIEDRPFPSSLPTPLPANSGPESQEHRNIAESFDNSDSRSQDVVAAYSNIVVPRGYTYKPGEHESKTIRWFVEYLVGTPSKYTGPPRPELWTNVVYRWADLQECWEKVPGFKDKKAPKEKRPVCIETWNKTGRTRSLQSLPPEGTKLEVLRVQWWQWWTSVHPNTASRQDGFVLPDTSLAVDEMHMRGEHGIVLFLVLLRWWHDLGGYNDPCGMWEEATKSVYVVMDLMVNRIIQDTKDRSETVTTGVKRKHEKEGKGAKSAKRRQR